MELPIPFAGIFFAEKIKKTLTTENFRYTIYKNVFVMEMIVASIKDVAQIAGVSIGTVSRAFNNYSDICDETRQRIYEAAKSINYVPNINARNLSSKRNHSYALVISGFLDENPNESILVAHMRGVFQFAIKNNLEFAVHMTGTTIQKKQSYKSFCEEHAVSGVILSGITTDDPYFLELTEHASIPCVAIDISIPSANVGSVSVDNFSAMRDMTFHLFEMGHRDICVITGKKHTSVNAERLAGVRAAYDYIEASLSDEDIYCGDFSQEKAYQIIVNLIATGKLHKYTAFLCFSDFMAMGVLEALKKNGFSVPNDFSVTGFDDIPQARYVSPPLTTIRQNFTDAGVRAGKLLYEMVHGSKKRQDVISYDLVKRESVKNSI